MKKPYLLKTNTIQLNKTKLHAEIRAENQARYAETAQMITMNRQINITEEPAHEPIIER
jgi:hypothetical protein